MFQEHQYWGGRALGSLLASQSNYTTVVSNAV